MTTYTVEYNIGYTTVTNCNLTGSYYQLRRTNMFLTLGIVPCTANTSNRRSQLLIQVKREAH